MKSKNSTAYDFMLFIWQKNKTESYLRLNSIMNAGLKLAIEAQFPFDENDFTKITNDMRGGYWFGQNANGKGTGEWFYNTAIEFNNTSAIYAYEKYLGITPFITKDGNRCHTGKRLSDKKFRMRVTGFDASQGKIYIVAYALKDWEGKGKKKLLKFDNKQWLEFRKEISE